MATTIVLVKPPERSCFNFGTFSLGVLAAAVRDLADVTIVDATVLAAEEAVRLTLSHRPDFVGVTVMSLSSVGPAADWIGRLRAGLGSDRHDSGALKIVAGGHGASMLPAPLLAAGADAVVIGEGETTFRRILRGHLRPGGAGLASLAGDRVVVGPAQDLIRPLDRLSPPARDLMPSPPDGVHLMETSRGCPHRCEFCEATRFHQMRWRFFSPERVVAEVRRLVDDQGAWIIHFADDNFAASRRRVLQICKALESGPLPACFVLSARADDLASDPRLLPAMAAARMLRISVGVETLNYGVATGVGKPIALDTYAEVFGRMRELGMFSVASLIVGLPGEGPEIRERSLDLTVTAGPDAAQFIPFLPLPGTPLAWGPGNGDPDRVDVLDAQRFTQAFFRNSTVRERLQAAARAGGVRAHFARATIEKRFGADLATSGLNTTNESPDQIP